MFVPLGRKCEALILIFNVQPPQTSGPSTSCSWRSSTMNACCPTSPPCRRTGVLWSLSSLALMNVEFVFMHVCTLCSQRASGERRTVRAVLQPSPTASVGHTWRRSGRSAGLTSGSSRAAAPPPAKAHAWFAFGCQRCRPCCYRFLFSLSRS